MATVVVDALSQEDHAFLMDFYEKSELRLSTVMFGGESLISGNRRSTQVTTIDPGVTNVLQRIVPPHDDFVFVLSRANYDFVKYQPGDFFSEHVDFSPIDMLTMRYFTAIICLQPADEGGETSVGACLYPLGARSLIFFDSQNKHAGMPVMSGTKVVVKFDLIGKRRGSIDFLRSSCDFNRLGGRNDQISSEIESGIVNYFAGFVDENTQALLDFACITDARLPPEFFVGDVIILPITGEIPTGDHIEISIALTKHIVQRHNLGCMYAGCVVTDLDGTVRHDDFNMQRPSIKMDDLEKCVVIADKDTWHYLEDVIDIRAEYQVERQPTGAHDLYGSSSSRVREIVSIMESLGETHGISNSHHLSGTQIEECNDGDVFRIDMYRNISTRLFYVVRHRFITAESSLQNDSKCVG
jgi:hypothetical protein